MLFKTIATFATFALSAVSVLAVHTGQTEASALVKKAQPQSLPQIFAGATQSLTPLTQQLRAYLIPPVSYFADTLMYTEGLGPNDLTTAKVTPIVNNIKTVLNGVVTDVKALQGQPASVVLANNGVSPNFGENAIITVGAVAAIIAQLLRVRLGIVVLLTRNVWLT